MANQFVSIPVPAANGSGAAVDVSTFAALKTAVFSIGTANDDLIVTLEFSNDAGAVSWQPVVSEQGSGGQVIAGAFRWLRATVTNYKRGTPADVQIGGVQEAVLFATPVAPAADGVGAAVNISALPVFQTVQCGGTFRGNVVLELSEDGVTWGEFYSFSNPGYESKLIIAQFARIRRTGVPTIAPGLPTISIGATGIPGGGADDGNAMRFTYTATGAEGMAFTVPLPAARDDATYLVWVNQADVDAAMVITCPSTGRTVNDFPVETSAPLVAGDELEFFVADPT